MLPPRQKASAAHRTNEPERGYRHSSFMDTVIGKPVPGDIAPVTGTRRSRRLIKTEDGLDDALSDSTTATTATTASGRTTAKLRARDDRLAAMANHPAIDRPGSPDSVDTTASDRDPVLVESQDAVGVQHVLQGLARMERRLRRAAKRQRLKVEESVGEVSVELRSQQEQPDESRSRGQTPASRGRQAQLSIKDQAAHAAAEGGSESYDIAVSGAHSSTTADDTRCAWKGKASRSGEQSPKKPAAPEAPADRGAARPPQVDSDYLPLPWKGRLGYACLNTYLRTSKPSVFCSRTCRMASIIDHRYPLADPTQPEHPSRNRPDKSQKPDKARGLRFVQELGLANARDIVKMLRWNERYGIRFMRLSSEMFPFASHLEHGYKLAPFASEVLAEAGRVAAQLGHRLTTHPGQVCGAIQASRRVINRPNPADNSPVLKLQFTQLGSPREDVIHAAVRDLEYHDEMLTLLKLPEQQDRDAVMILHMGGVYGDKEAALERFRENYRTRLSDSIKRRLVLENDDVSWSVHDLLPVCEELNIPLVLDFHHHNIVFDPAQCREGTADLMPLIPRIRATWERKGITMKMHYSEPCAGAVTPRDRRKHSPRVASLPPCPPDVDLMIEAKDKEQAVFELMRNFRLPGHQLIRTMIPHQRVDEQPAPAASARAETSAKKKKAALAASGASKRKKGGSGGSDVPIKEESQEDEQEERPEPPQIPEEEIGMGGPEGRVYWPPGMESWLHPLTRDQKRKYDALERYDAEGLDELKQDE